MTEQIADMTRKLGPLSNVMIQSIVLSLVVGSEKQRLAHLMQHLERSV